MDTFELECCIQSSFGLNKTEIPVGIIKEDDEGNSFLIPLSYIPKTPNIFKGDEDGQKKNGPFRISVKDRIPPKVSSRRVYLIAKLMILIFILLLVKYALCIISDQCCFDVLNCFSLLANITYRRFLMKLYREGPAIPIFGVTIGFWDGLTDAEVCSQLTAGSISFWQDNKTECNDIMNRKTTNFYQMFEFFVLTYVAISTLRSFITSIFRF